MVRSSALALLGALVFTAASQMHVRDVVAPAALTPMTAAIDDPAGRETLTVFYSPLETTRVAHYVGLGTAYHMALVYTDREGVSRAVSSGPSNLATPQTPEYALSAVFASFDEQPSAFGTLTADPKNNTPFVAGSSADFYTKDKSGHAYPHTTLLRGDNLSARWGSILRTYARTDAMKLTYSPVTQNSNSLAGTALRQAGIVLASSSSTLFVPGAFTRLP